jgi:hypothetical protein
MPDSVSVTMETGKSTTLSLSFTVSQSVSSLDVDVEIVPALEDFVTVSPTSFSGLQGGQTYPLDITIAAPLGFANGDYSGTVKLRKTSSGGGGISSQPLQVSLTIIDDLALPEVTITTPLDGDVFGASPITVDGTLDDPFATLTLAGVPVAVAGGLWSATVPLGEGANYLTAVAQDQVGKIGTASIEVTLDTTPPTVVIDTPLDGFVSIEPAIAVAGLVNDFGVGTEGETVTVSVNGVAAAVANRGFLAEAVPLAAGDNILTASAEDMAGNLASDQITVTYDPLTGQPQIRLVSGDTQSGVINTELPAPLVVSLQDGAGTPVVGATVIFKVLENDGTLDDGGPGARAVAVTTDGAGEAQAFWTLGSRAGAGLNLVTATALGYEGSVLFNGTGLPGLQAKINVDSGNVQVGETGKPLPLPLAVVVTDGGHNRLADVPVTFTVTAGTSHFNGLAQVTVETDGSGRALALPTLGLEEGINNTVIDAHILSGPTVYPATFVASAKAAGDPALTSVSGVVLDNTNDPIEGVTVAIPGTALTTQSDTQGQFTLPGAPVGHIPLQADGTTANRPGTWPALDFELTTIAGQDNTLGMPVFLLPLDTVNQLCVDDVTGGTLATFLDGTATGCLSVTTVHADKVPMTPNFGQQPRFIVTIQPAGVLFDPPAPITIPNSDGLAPGAITELYSFDHDLGQFTAIGTGAVASDGLTIASDPGVGVLKAGWHCGGDPLPGGGAANVEVEVTLDGQVLKDDPLTGELPTIYVPVMDPAIPDSGMIELVAQGTPLPFDQTDRLAHVFDVNYCAHRPHAG